MGYEAKIRSRYGTRDSTRTEEIDKGTRHPLRIAIPGERGTERDERVGQSCVRGSEGNLDGDWGTSWKQRKDKEGENYSHDKLEGGERFFSYKGG